MSYVMGFVAAVPTANKEAYRRFAQESVDYFKSLGVKRMVETWGDDVPRGETTDFHRAVDAREGEEIVYSFQIFPDKATADAANEKMMNDPAMQDMGAKMPFDGARMIFGGFETLSDLQSEGQSAYIDGSVIAVPTASKSAYAEGIDNYFELFKEYGAVRMVEAWGDFVPEGKLTDFKRAVAAKPDETVVFRWIEWPSKEVRNRAWEALFAHPLIHQGSAIFDGRRRIVAGFVPIVDA
ncbi:DUF1428 domain-containing protein [Pelagibacterium sp. H642]|uniref:DUF1428 domain-containing protein n=1 Tax=Pelagibacterium sp. H642 TaxID=1881069 RepID=UPI0028167B84|nr:DUF1428 domain-containing protein [Pelagibacterium sp. H642]WMT91509.1 DUF1428 domain-containing protein [Pelagibacterium sp. H642]